MELEKTGINGLDEFLGGGLPPIVVLLMGSTDNGCETFARQVASYRSFKKRITYFTVSRTPEMIKNEMEAYNIDVSFKEEAGRWKFITIDGDSDTVKDDVLREMKKNRSVVIDSISDLFLHQDGKDIFELVSAMNKQNSESKDLHFILLTKGMQDQKLEVAMQHFTSGTIDFETVWQAEGVARNMIIQNMLGTVIPIHRLPYTIGSRGFTIDTATRIT